MKWWDRFGQFVDDLLVEAALWVHDLPDWAVVGVIWVGLAVFAFTVIMVAM